MLSDSDRSHVVNELSLYNHITVMLLYVLDNDFKSSRRNTECIQLIRIRFGDCLLQICT